MADLESNKQTVRAFYNLAFNDKQPAEAVAQYVGPVYIQHNPQAGDGVDAFVAFAGGFVAQVPDLHLDIRRVVAEGDIVVTHSLLKTSEDDAGSVVPDFWRLEDGRIVEHWDVAQPFPETSVNDHPMF